MQDLYIDVEELSDSGLFPLVHGRILNGTVYRQSGFEFKILYADRECYQIKVYVLVNKSVFKDRNRKELSYNGTPSSKVGFYLANIDNDGIPELIISANLSGEDAYTILTYRYGKIKRVTYRVHDAFRGYYPKTGIYIAKDKGGGEVYWRKNGTENEIVMSKSVYGPNSYRINSTPVSIKSFAAYRTRITNGTPLKIVKFYSNTAANRNQKLK